jgi:glycerol-3-phosphate dehydrogenase (NAD(P)+)
MGYGDNTKAALMTRGLAEMTRLGVRMGAHPETFSGLAGIGDLIVTCTSMHSRNRRCGVMIGEGMDPKAARDRVGMVVEGIFTAEAAVELAAGLGVELPITESVYRVVKGELTPHDALAGLMTRPARHESEAVE